MKNIIYVDPQEIKKLSPVAGSAKSRREKAKSVKCYWENGFLYGNWDLTKRTINNSLTSRDYQLFKNNKPSVYNWQKLYDSFKDNGYVQNPEQRYIEIGIGRTGELLLVDGRHRLYLAQQMNISLIPVNVFDIHPDYNFNNLSIIKNNVIPEFLYNLISNKWDKNIKIYHHWGTINHRYKLVKKYLPLLKNKNVLEIGCNSGMMMWSIMKYADTLVELEKQEKYCNQCKITNKLLFDMETVITLNKSLQEFEQYEIEDCNALYASFVLYHLNNDEIEILKNKILSKCKVVIIPNRQKERRNQINSYYLNRDCEIVKLLESCGFKTKIDTSFEKGYSVVVGTK